MRTLVWSKTFARAFKRTIKKQPKFKTEVERTLKILVEDPFNPQLATHKLKGKLSGTWACSVAYDQRIIFEFVKSQTDDDEIFLIDIGTHDEVY